MLSAPRTPLKVRPIILSSTSAGPPLLPGLTAASIWMRKPLGVRAVADELDPRDDPLGDRQAGAAGRVAVDGDGLLDLGQLLGPGQGGRLSKNDSSSSLSTARSIPGAAYSTVAASFSPDWLGSTNTWLA